MKKIIYFVLVFALTGCAKKEWSKDALVNDCLKDLNKRNAEEKKFEQIQIAYLCDCMSDKMLSKYKSEKESSKDKAGLMQIGQDCAAEVRGK